LPALRCFAQRSAQKEKSSFPYNMRLTGSSVFLFAHSDRSNVFSVEEAIFSGFSFIHDLLEGAIICSIFGGASTHIFDRR
jgi:hypothetical protein